MSLHPIRALDHVIEEYSDYLRTEFRAKDPDLRAALERELFAPRFLSQEPFFQAHRPFKSGKRWRDLPIDPKLARVMEERSGSPAAYTHQSAAIEELLEPSARPIAVTTGTGSGKTEAFLLPVIQNAFEDAVRFRKSGLTAVLIYPMNALANDQKQRIDEYLQSAGIEGVVRALQYDRGTTQAQRQEMRANPPQILLTNYMMLEYLLVRPADREGIFANHRCRFLVLDEVHTYRGVLGSNIALLIRRLKVHLARATQDWKPVVVADEQQRRYPSLVPVGTSATIKSLSEVNLSPAEMLRERDAAVREFFGALTGVERSTIQVFGEELQELQTPPEARYPVEPGRVNAHALDVSDPEAVRAALCRLTGAPTATPLAQLAHDYRLLWDLNRWLIRTPMSLTEIAARVKAEVSQRAATPDDVVRHEVEAALTIGAALPDRVSGAVRLRAHRFLRGGWRFHRCVNPDCGKLYPMGEERCGACNQLTAPLYLCRNCGADYLRMVGDLDHEPLHPSADEKETPEWMVYEPGRFDLTATDDDDDEDDENGGPPPVRPKRGQQQVPAQIKRRPVLTGSLDPASLQFSSNPTDYRLSVMLAPARSRCLCCGGTAGSRNVITPVGLGTSAAVKVVGEGLVEALAEANQDRPGHDGKERLLVFSDSRQDAAHQARFIIFASRYDRMRRRLVQLLHTHKTLTIQRAVELLSDLGVTKRDNPHVPEATDWLPDEARERIRAWEEAPLLDEIAVNAGYRSTVFNLGLAGITYHRLGEYVTQRGGDIVKQFSIKPDDFEHLCRTLLDEIRVRGALSRPMLQYHPRHTACPRHFQAADWERQLKDPQGYPLTHGGDVIAYLDRSHLPVGIKHHNAWRRHGAGGRPPSLQRILAHLLARMGGVTPDERVMIDLLTFLKRGSFLKDVELYGIRDREKLLQVNEEVVRLEMLTAASRVRCEVCGDVLAGAAVGMPCPNCHGALVHWTDAEVAENHHVRRILNPDVLPLVAGEHTAQVTNDDRAILEAQFKAGVDESPMNVLACSPTLEMGIDVGGLDAIILRNVPPRPDNYAQRGGRAGRRSRVGLVLAYARSTPHDQYFYDKPREMIAGEVPAPALSLGNRDVLVRHLYAIVFGAAQPGLAGRMADYVGPQGEIKEESVAALIQGVEQQIEHALTVAREAWGDDVLANAHLADNELRTYLEKLPARIRDVFQRTSRQVIELRQALEFFSQRLERRSAGTRAAELVARLLGIPTEMRRDQSEADDRSAGYPLRRFAEFGLLPGYEFPSEPAALRLLNDDHEEDPLTVTRRFGIGQFQPEANVYARRRRWRVIGLDTASPWNPRSDGPTWSYRVCGGCQLRYNADEPACPRCQNASPGPALPAYDFAGFIASRDEQPILNEEDRFAVRNVVRVYPQWDGEVVGRWSVGAGWALRLSRGETVRWVNESRPPTPTELQNGLPILHAAAKGYLLCPSCGRILDPPAPVQNPGRGRRNAGGAAANQLTNGHSDSCPNQGATPRPLAISTSGGVEVLRLLMPVPRTTREGEWNSLALSLGYALLNGIQHHFMLSSGELDFEMEGPWICGDAGSKYEMLSLAFIDPSLGGSGYLGRVAESLHTVASRAIEHLDHPNCDTGCYRCLKTYYNQRFHEHLQWPQAMPALEELSAAPSVVRPLQAGDIDDPRPWLEAYAAGVGSPLELKFLRLFEQHGFHPQKQVSVAPGDSGPPISVADFAVAERRLAIYIDGAAFHRGDRLRRDRFIRGRLRNGTPPWRVEELRAADLAQGADLVSRLTR